MDTISLKTREHELYNITDEVKKSVENSGVKDGLCLVYTPHSTAGVLIACGIDPDALTDVDNFIRKVVPMETPFAHTCDPKTDAAGHLKTILTNVSRRSRSKRESWCWEALRKFILRSSTARVKERFM